MIWRNRELLTELVIRNLRVKYQRSVFGFLWTLIQPAAMSVVLISVFTYVVRIDLDNYWAFLISGYFLWNFLQQCLSAASMVFEEHANVIRSIALPTELLLIGVVLSRLVEFLLEITIVLIIVTIAHHQSLPSAFAALPVLFLLQTIVAVGLSAPIAILSAFYKDVTYALPLILMILFYLSPVFYPVSMVPEQYQLFFIYNPIAQILELYHSIVYAGELASGADFLRASVTSLAILLVGHFLFNRYKNILPEVV